MPGSELVAIDSFSSIRERYHKQNTNGGKNITMLHQFVLIDDTLATFLMKKAESFQVKGVFHSLRCGARLTSSDAQLFGVTPVVAQSKVVAWLQQVRVLSHFPRPGVAALLAHASPSPPGHNSRVSACSLLHLPLFPQP